MSRAVAIGIGLAVVLGIVWLELLGMYWRHPWMKDSDRWWWIP